jgi:hypothetical protein
MGWTNAVILDGTREDPLFAARLDVRLAPSKGGYPYHVAADVEPDRRREALDTAIGAVREHVLDIVVELVTTEEIEVAGVVVGKGLGRIPLDKVLASSRLFHTAEAAVYYEALRDAVSTLGLPAATVSYGDAEASDLWGTASSLKAQAGAPWQKDHKMAAVAALLAMPA